MRYVIKLFRLRVVSWLIKKAFTALEDGDRHHHIILPCTKDAVIGSTLVLRVNNRKSRHIQETPD